ncbi:hypothetical protein [Flavobacterium sp. 7A]|uniref:hypothetical protein n=1 Tax=Flavobacterium sp. 7A TaxID=2940571 RepID=UPI0022277657|nr:hypothetical protein [Flavobacterium sp. 7A]MCW2119535.1 hypothetical protein [Flavobacterium sp. 7A]
MSGITLERTYNIKFERDRAKNGLVNMIITESASESSFTVNPMIALQATISSASRTT